MREFRLRSDLERVVTDGFAWPLGVAPDHLPTPSQGYTVTYNTGRDDEPDTYTFHIVITHDRLAGVIGRAFDLLPEQVFGIIEIGSRDAYRSVDVFLGGEMISRDAFLATWRQFEPFLLEDVSIGAGANSEDPFIEVFLDQWKGLSIHVPLMMRDDLESMLSEFGLAEVDHIWPQREEDTDDFFADNSKVRPVLDLRDEYSPDVDELLLQLRYAWRLELDVDPDKNVDDNGRELGLTLWHAVAILAPADEREEGGAYASLWATARSMAEMEQLLEQSLRDHPEWLFSEVYTIDRVAYDERPDNLSDLPPRLEEAKAHLLQIEPWPSSPPPSHSGGRSPAGGT